MKRSFWLSRTAGGVLAGVIMAGAGAGVAIAGASGASDQYTAGAKPYAGVQPHDVTVGTQTFPSSVTTTIANSTATVTTPYYIVGTTTSAAQTAALQYAYGALQAAITALNANAATIKSLLKPDLRTLLAGTNHLATTRGLATTKRLRFSFTSPGAGKLKVLWKLSAPGHSSAYYINETSTLRRAGDLTVNLVSRSAGRKLASGAQHGVHVAASVTDTPTGGAAVTVTRNYTLKR